MTAIDDYARLKRLGMPVIHTGDAAAALHRSPSAASHLLARLAEAGLVARVRPGMWWVDGPVDAYRLATWLTAPMDSYLSLQTALHFHGLVEQVPERHYLVSQARSQQIDTSVGRFSVHHVIAELFGGFEPTAQGAPMASAEKALFDLAWLSATRVRLFARLPEVTLPPGFDRGRIDDWIGRIPSVRGRTYVEAQIARLLAAPGHDVRSA